MRNSLINVAIVLSLLFVFSPLVSYADQSQLIQYETQSMVFQKNAGNEVDCHKSRFNPYEPSYMVYQKAEGDEWALRAHYSFKYDLYPVDTVYHGKNEKTCSDSFVQSIDSNLSPPINEVFLSYTGEFDFYVGTRDSGPVINRISNPALHVRHAFVPIKWWLDIGVFEHRSNGQVVEVTDTAGAARAQLAYIQNDHKFFDGISRGANYISFEAHNYSLDDYASFYAKLKMYFSRSSEITWGSLAGGNTSISDYDRIKLVLRKSIKDGEMSVEWMIGC